MRALCTGFSLLSPTHFPRLIALAANEQQKLAKWGGSLEG